jgi:SHS family lactate transporter-like MFS transporter
MNAAERVNQRNAVLAGFLGWTLDAFDFFVLTFVVQDIATAFGKPRAVIAATVGLALITRPIGAIVFGLIADRYGRRLPLMLNVIFYAFISVLCDSLKLQDVRRAAAALRYRDGRRVGFGASLALESASPRLRGLLSGLLQEGYALGDLLAARLRHRLRAGHAAHPECAWRVFFLGGAPRSCRCSSARR